VAVITGASSGLGAEFARQLAARRHDLLLVARREERLRSLADDLSERHGIAADYVLADLASEYDLERIAERISNEPLLELLVNNAGFGSLGYFFRAGLDPQICMHRVHVLATVRLTHTALNGMTSRGHGAIINVSSVAGFSRMPGYASYASTKAWMTAFTECLYLELQAIGSPVRIQVLCPGYTYTEFHDVLHLDRDKVWSNRKWWMTAQFVVSESLKGLDRDAWMVIPGWRYRMLVHALRWLPHFVLHPVVARVARRREAAALPPQ
jgi:short-subunit dehydrogenase